MSWISELLPRLRLGAGANGIPFHDYFPGRMICVEGWARGRHRRGPCAGRRP